MIGIGGTEVRQVNCSESLSDMLASDQQSSAGHQQTVNNNITRGQSSWIKGHIDATHIIHSYSPHGDNVPWAHRPAHESLLITV